MREGLRWFKLRCGEGEVASLELRVDESSIYMYSMPRLHNIFIHPQLISISITIVVNFQADCVSSRNYHKPRAFRSKGGNVEGRNEALTEEVPGMVYRPGRMVKCLGDLSTEI